MLAVPQPPCRSPLLQRRLSSTMPVPAETGSAAPSTEPGLWTQTRVASSPLAPPPRSEHSLGLPRPVCSSAAHSDGC